MNRNTEAMTIACGYLLTRSAEAGVRHEDKGTLALLLFVNCFFR